MSSTKLMTFELIDRLSLIVNNTKPLPLTNRIMVDKEEMSNLLKRLEESIPGDVKQARQILEVEAQILDESRKEADSTVKTANSQAQATIESANSQAKATVESANQQAQSTVAEAQARASETLRSVTDQANAMMADAQARANALVADAQARAQQLVAESEIIARAQAEAQEMLESAHRECEDYTTRVHGAVAQMLEHADISLSQQLDALRTLRQEIHSNQ